MVIYQTTFDAATKRCTSVSMMTGYRSLTEAMFSRPERPLTVGRRTLVYPTVCFTDWVMSLDAGVNPAIPSRQNTYPANPT